MHDKAVETIRDYEMFSQGDTLIAGVSGGADSVALLYFLCGLRQEWGIRIFAAHVNHNLRGDESDRDEAFVRSLCEQLQVELVVTSPEIRALAKEHGKSIEECAREERYRFFSALAGEKGKIATAHTRNDNVETQLLNLARGTGLRGLTGIPPVRGNIVRPLIRCTREEIEAYCKKHSLDWVTDSSNHSDDYTRNRLRHHVLPVLEEINPGLLAAAGHTMELLREDEAYLQAQAEEALGGLVRPDGKYERDLYLSLPAPLTGRMLVLLCRERRLPYDRGRIALMDRCIRAGKGGVQLRGDCRFNCGAEAFWFDNPAAEPEKEAVQFAVLSIDALESVTRIPCGTGKTVEILHMKREEFEYLYKNNRNLLINALDCARIGKIVTLRNRTSGDYFYPMGRGCGKTMKKLFQELKIPREERAFWPILAGEDGFLRWIWGAGAGEPYGISENTRYVMLMKMVEEE